MEPKQENLRSHPPTNLPNQPATNCAKQNYEIKISGSKIIFSKGLTIHQNW